MADSVSPVLSSIEARVLGVLVEKQHTVPDSYPLSLNALVSGCNQKSNRFPVMQVSQTDVLEAIEKLEQVSLVSESSGGRVTRYAHHFEEVFNIPVQSVALIAMLLLRGPQTAGELRIHCERLHKFADISSVEAFLEEMTVRSSGSLVVKLPRKTGARENRWFHLLSEDSDNEAYIDTCALSDRHDSVSFDDFHALKSDFIKLEAEVAVLRKAVDQLKAQILLQEKHMEE